MKLVGRIYFDISNYFHTDFNAYYIISTDTYMYSLEGLYTALPYVGVVEWHNRTQPNPRLTILFLLSLVATAFV